MSPFEIDYEKSGVSNIVIHYYENPQQLLKDIIWRIMY